MPAAAPPVVRRRTARWASSGALAT